MNWTIGWQRSNTSEGSYRPARNQKAFQRTLSIGNHIPTRPKPSGLVSVDDPIDEVARKALEEARRVEENEKYRKNPGPLVPPDPKVKTQ